MIPVTELSPLPKSRGGKSKRILYQSFPKGHFFSVFGQVWQKNGMSSYLMNLLMCHFSSTHQIVTKA
jgi:hypothetical protein